jgi:hypothetical protein
MTLREFDERFLSGYGLLVFVIAVFAAVFIFGLNP